MHSLKREIILLSCNSLVKSLGHARAAQQKKTEPCLRRAISYSRTGDEIRESWSTCPSRHCAVAIYFQQLASESITKWSFVAKHQYLPKDGAHLTCTKRCDARRPSSIHVCCIVLHGGISYCTFRRRSSLQPHSSKEVTDSITNIRSSFVRQNYQTQQL